MEWQPQQEPLQQLARFLKDTLNGRDPAAQKNAELMLKQAGASPDINNYLAYLLSNSQAPAGLSLTPGEYTDARCAAALMLKNNIRPSYKAIPESSKAYIRTVVLQALQDDNQAVRSQVGNVITEIVLRGGIMAWPQVLSELISLVQDQSGGVSIHTRQGAISALRKICEDNKRGLNRDYDGQRPLDFLFPKLLEITTIPTAAIRSQALAAINCFILEKSRVVEANMDSLLLHLFQISSDTDLEVRKFVVRAFTQITEVSPQRVIPHMEGLVDYMITQQKNIEHEVLAVDAAEFWLCIGEDAKIRGCLGPFLPKIVPVLLESMVYAEDEILRLADGGEDAHLEDRQEDLKPRFARSKSARHPTANGDTTIEPSNGSTKGDSTANNDNDLEEGEYEEDDDDDDGDDDLLDGEGEDSWNLRKCSAATLDVLASVFHEPVFEVTLPYLKQNLSHAEWPNREAAVLALGAIADGCMEVVQPHLPDLTHYLISLLQDKQPVVRSITCWSLGRYSAWASQLDPAGKAQFFEPMMDGILKCMLDNNKRVQEAAASAFASLEEKAGQQLKSYCAVIVNQFVQCFAKYKDRNMFILYDCVQTLAEHVGPSLAQPDLVQTLMPALIQRWSKVSDYSKEMFPLLECLSYVATALNDAFAPFAKPIFERCINIIHQNLEDYMKAVNNPALDEPEKDFLVTSLDLLSAIIQALEEQKSVELVTTSSPNIFELLAYCMEDANNDVRQSAYALLGDCAIYVFQQLQPFLPSVLEILITQLDLPQVLVDGEETGYSVINNACWSVGEIAMRQHEGMAPYVDRLLQKLVTILFNNKVPESLNENAAIAVGRLGIGCSEQIAPHLATFAPFFVRAIQNVDWTDEKGHALTGFVKIILCNPQAMESCLLEFFVELASAPRDFLDSPVARGRKECFRTLLLQYQNLIPDFNTFLQHMPTAKEQALRQLYAL